MDAQEKSQIINAAYENEKYAEQMKSLEYIKENDNEFGPVADDGLSLFRPHNLKPIADEMNRSKTANLSIADRIKMNRNRKQENCLYGFKWRADQHIGYILEQFIRNEPVILKSGKTSKNKTFLQNYAVVASYNFYTGNIEVNILSGSEIDSMEFIGEIPNSEGFYYEYLLFESDKDQQRRSQQMTITVGLWEDMQKQIQKLETRIGELEQDLRDNYSRIPNSLEY